ncbi:MAG: sigma-54-dependent Fis family transcriptional regulator [Gammaproteobacteria bacterium]|nr:MAG: sigma-54-dependent Fis family transcriptional regulator [Gammaproteobacteria bacterium]PIE36744.1 MAG: sigma-54-dependent Fis family transcriptional regulator [Gammaproteobacteria bacterium]
MHTALIIDDEADIRQLIALSLDRIGIDTHVAANLAEARELLRAYRFDVCLTDMKLPDGNGVDFVREIVSQQANLPVAVITAHGNMDAAVEAMKNGAFDFVSKPVDIELLRKLVKQAVALNAASDASAAETTESASGCEEGQPDDEYINPAPSPAVAAPDEEQPPERRNHASDATVANHAIPASASAGIAMAAEDKPVPHEQASTVQLRGGERLIGHSAPVEDLRRLIFKVSRTNAPVWITGESGTGKELIARLIHENSPRANGPFVAINCGAIPGELVESQLFGHRKGSFTGAHADHDGFFRQAEGGTLLLDEVADLPLHMQVKLLRVAQERMIRPVGSKDEFPVDVRILSASYKHLDDEVAAGRFRQDLFYRLNVITLTAPSLSARGDDILLIARHLLARLTNRFGLPEPLEFSGAAEAALLAHTYPGNVRELENILERAAALVDGTTIEVADLGLDDRIARADAVVTNQHVPDADAPSTPATHTTTPSDQRNTSSFMASGLRALTANKASRSAASDDNGDEATHTRRTNERDRILDCLQRHRWNRKAAAKELGLTYRQLRYRIGQYGLDRDTDG